MKIISIAAVSGGGKTTVVNMLKENLDNVCSLHFDDYPFAYCNEQIKKYIDKAIFIDTPLDVALARRILRDMTDASGDEIRNDLELYLKYARIAFVQMQKDVLPTSDYVVDGTMNLDNIAEKIVGIIIDSN